MISNNHPRVFTVQGSFEEMAFSQGEQFKESFPQVLTDLKKVPVSRYPWMNRLIPQFVFVGILDFMGNKFLKAHSPVLENYGGQNLLKNLDALAKGLNQKAHRLYSFCAFEAVSSKLPYSLGCSSLAFSNIQTGNHGPVLAYNHDFPVAFGPHLRVKKSLPTEGYSCLSLTYFPLLGAIAGVNEKGFAISLNHAYALDIHREKALPITWLVQQCLFRCATVDEAIELIAHTPVPNGAMITLLDKSGKSAVAEMSGRHKRVRHPTASYQCTFNKYQHPDMEPYQIPLEADGEGVYKGHKIHHHNIERHKRFAEIFNAGKNYSLDQIHQLMADHGADGVGSLGTICRHHPQTGSTLASILLFPKTSSLGIIFGPPCKGKYEEVRL